MARFIASDYDGTISCGGDSIKNNAEAISRWRKKGNFFAVVTGRGTPIVNELKGNGVETDYVLCNNGSVCIKDGELIFVERNDVKMVPDLVSFISKQGAGYFGLVCPEQEKGFTTNEIPEDLLTYPDFAQLTAICGSNEDASRISEAINKEYEGILISYANGQFIDIVKYGVSKATGISRVAEMLGVEEKNIYAVGDNLNDIVMIKAFNGYAVENAREQVKAAADVVIPTVADMINSLLSE